jgi:hypothetical protein
MDIDNVPNIPNRPGIPRNYHSFRDPQLSRLAQQGFAVLFVLPLITNHQEEAFRVSLKHLPGSFKQDEMPLVRQQAAYLSNDRARARGKIEKLTFCPVP